MTKALRHSWLILLWLVRPLPVMAAPDPPESFTCAAGGDLIGPYRTLAGLDDPGLRAISALFQSADVGFANQEGSVFDLDSFDGYPAAENGGGYPLSPTAVAHDLRSLGLSVVSKANNHATDYGIEGLLQTLRTLASAGIAQAGSGLSDREARAPVYVNSPHGRMALISAASTFPPMSVAGPPVTRRGITMRPRPGISALHVRALHTLRADVFSSLDIAAGDAALRENRGGIYELRVGDEFFRIGSPTGSSWDMQPSDVAEILSAIREARAQAGMVVFALHAHQTAGNQDDLPPADFEPMVLHRANEAASPDDPRPAAFETSLFHQAIDAGADVVVRTGPHVLNGIEIYHGKPIFYSLGSLFFDFNGRRTYTTPNGQVMRFPDAWFETVIPVIHFTRGRLAEIQLHPAQIDSSDRPTDGLPRPASEAATTHILQRLQSMSSEFGTAIQIKDGIGIVRAPAPNVARGAQ
jgi:poly-gamma-glutamate capsule biosynthesis protein CapA/YwtB (metallophosphatase superfamily)